MTGFARISGILVLVVIAVIALLMLMPLGTAASALGVSARHSQGTILSGTLRDASLGRVKIGDINARLNLLPLFTGRFGFTLERGDSLMLPGVSGTVGSGMNGMYADALTAAFDGGGLVRGLEGSEIRFESTSFAFANGKCASASGGARLSLEQTALGSVMRSALSGKAECSEGDLFIPLLSQSTLERILVRVKGNGDFQATIMVLEPSPENMAALSLVGFTPVSGGMRLVRSGKLN
jgi:general secretion pathway protein N